MSVEIPAAKNRRSKLIYLALLFSAFTLAYTYTFDAKPSKLGDNASYYILGKALFEGEGYVDLSRISHRPNNHYPPGYPVIISAIMLFSSGILVIKLVNGLFFLLALWGLFELFTRLTNNLHFAFAVSFLCLLNAHLLFYASIMVSEIPFLLFSSLSLLAFMKADCNTYFWKYPYLIASILCLIVSYYIRSMGVALLFGFLLYFLLKKRWMLLLLYSTAFAAAALPWVIRGQKLGGSSYVKQLKMVNPYLPELGQAVFSDFTERILVNFCRYVTREIPSAIFPVFEPTYNSPPSASEWMVGMISLLLLAYGIYTLPKYRCLIGGYVLATLGILLLWPDVWIGVRFSVPLIPFVMLGWFFGCYALLKQGLPILNQKKHFQPLWLLLASFIYLLPLRTLHTQAKAPYAPVWRNYFEVANWVKENIPGNALVSTAKPGLFYLSSTSYVMRYRFAGDPAVLIADLEKNGVDYVVIDQVHKNTRRFLLPATQHFPERFEEIFRVKNSNTYLLRFKK